METILSKPKLNPEFMRVQVLPILPADFFDRRGGHAAPCVPTEASAHSITLPEAAPLASADEREKEKEKEKAKVIGVTP